MGCGGTSRHLGVREKQVDLYEFKAVQSYTEKPYLGWLGRTHDCHMHPLHQLHTPGWGGRLLFSCSWESE